MKKTKISRRKSLFFLAVIVIGTLVTSFIVLETYLRLTSQPQDLFIWTGRKSGKNPMSDWAMVDAFCAYRARPGAYMNERNKTVNSFGFISSPEIPVRKRAGETRIAFFGGSSTAGTGFNLPDSETWPWKVAMAVQRKFPDRQVTYINAAVGGYSSFESYSRLCTRVRFFQPDIIVLYHGWNEMYYFSEEKAASMEKWRTNPDGSWDFDKTAPIKFIEPKWIDNLIRYSQLFVYLRLKYATLNVGELGGKYDLATDEIFDPRGLEIWRTNLKLFRQAADIFGTELFVCKQATTIVPALKNESTESYIIKLQGFNYDSHVEAFDEIYKVIDDEIEPERIIDLRPLSGKEELFFDHVHLNPAGTSRTADIVADKLIEYLSAPAEISPPAP